MSNPISTDELFGQVPKIDCKRFGATANTFIETYIEKWLSLTDRKQEYDTFLKVMDDESIDATHRNWIWLRRAKSFERAMDRIIMIVAVHNFKCQHGKMPSLEDILGDDDGFEDRYNYEDACNVEGLIWPSWPMSFRRHVMNTLMYYFSSLFGKAYAEHSRSRYIAYNRAV
jgi:hypothetical protein